MVKQGAIVLALAGATLGVGLIEGAGFVVSRGFVVQRATGTASGGSAALPKSPLADRVYLFTGRNCAPCAKVKVETLPELMRRGIRVGVENGHDVQIVDQGTNPEWFKAYGVKVLPTWVMIRGNQVVGSREGFLTAEEFLKWWEP